MKNLLTTLIVVLYVLGNLKAQTMYPSGVNNMIARWNFTNTGASVSNIYDVSGMGHDGTTTNLTSVPGFRGRMSEAMHFNGVSSVATVNHSTALNPQSITIAAMVRATGFYSGTYQHSNIIYKGYNYYIPGCWSMHLTDHKFDNNAATYYPTKQQLDFAGPYSGTYSLPAANYVDSGAWYFMAITYDGTTITRYQVKMDTLMHNNNVQQISSTVLGTALGTNTEKVFIGATQQPSFPYWFNGDMDEIVLFNRALNANEIQIVYDYLWEVFSISTGFTLSSICPGNTFDLPYVVKAGNAFATGNVFSAQLSDATGSFALPVTIGTTTATASGNIVCTIPANTPPGTGYKIRIRSSSPAEYTDVHSYNITVNSPTPSPTVNIVATPGTNIFAGQMVTFTATVTNGGATPSYQWRKNGINIPGATALTYSSNSLANGDIIRMSVHSSDPCAIPDSALSSSLTISISSDVANMAAITGINLYPNPTNGSFVISGKTAHHQSIPLEIVNSIGQIVYKSEIVAVNGMIKFSVELPSSVASGVYMLVIGQGEESTKRKFTLLRN